MSKENTVNEQQANGVLRIVSKRTLIMIRLFACVKNLRTFVLAVWYNKQRRKYSSIMTYQFINGYSLSSEYYKFQKLKKKDEYWSKKFDAVIEYYDSRYAC